MPPPYKNATCRGSYALGTACGHCERCADDRERMLDKSLKDRPEDTWKAELHEMHHRLAIALGLPPTGPHTTDWEGLIERAAHYYKVGDQPNRTDHDPLPSRWTDEVLEAFVRQDVAANAIIAFRQMRALESLAESLAELGRYLTTK